MRLLLLCFSLFSLACLFNVSASTAIHVATPQSRLEASTSYYFDLLDLVLQKTAADYGPAHLVFEPVPASGSLWKLIWEKKNRIDVHWLTPTNRNRHTAARPCQHFIWWFRFKRFDHQKQIALQEFMQDELCQRLTPIYRV